MESVVWGKAEMVPWGGPLCCPLHSDEEALLTELLVFITLCSCCTMASFLWGCVTDFFTYETTKSVVVKRLSVGIVNRIVQVLIIAYFVCYVFLHEKAYQTTDTGIESSVMTKVKGFGRHYGRIMDVADYVFPQEVTQAQIEASLAQSPGSQLSLKRGIKSSLDSGMPSLSISDQHV
uniref:Uncharacterized protein n=1 Tax=Knipowitschia caucasica TaxID=637954 RepID=A0AAV2MJC9_KNICA